MSVDDTEIRFPADRADVAVLDGYCHATGKDRTHVMQSILASWAASKLHEATVILRVVRGNPGASES